MGDLDCPLLAEKKQVSVKNRLGCLGSDVTSLDAFVQSEARTRCHITQLGIYLRGEMFGHVIVVLREVRKVLCGGKLFLGRHAL